MIDSKLRKTYDFYLINPLLKKFPGMQRISPNLITMLALVFGIAILPLLSFHHNRFAALTLICSGFLDTLDGYVARLRDLISPKGAVFDITSDRLIEFTVILGLYLQEPDTRGLLCLIMMGSILICITSFLVVGIFSANTSEKSFHYSSGIMERTEAFCFFIALILAPNFFKILSILFSVLVFFTAFQRIFQFASSTCTQKIDIK